MIFTPRNVASILLPSLALITIGCTRNSDKLVGKWKMTSLSRDGKQQKDPLGVMPVVEFTADGNIKAGIDADSLPSELKKLDKEAMAKLTEQKHFGKYKVSGDTIEFLDTKGDSLFGRSKEGTLKFEGDNLAITVGESVTMTFNRGK